MVCRDGMRFEGHTLGFAGGARRRWLGPGRRAGALVLALTLAGCAAAAVDPASGSGGPVAPPSRPPAAVSSTTPVAVLESGRYGYRLTIPAGWHGTETPGTGGLHPDEPGVDTFRDQVGHILSVTSEPAPTASGWTCAIARHLEHDHTLPVESSEDVIVAGRPARLLQYHLTISPYVIHYLTVEVPVDGRGLTFSLESTTKRDDEDRRILDGLIDGVELFPVS